MNEKPKILITDDSEINRALLKEILGDGYDYLEAEDGAAAVELMRQRTDISLLLLDLMMPGMDGFDVLRVMKYHAWLDEIPVIVISAAEDTANIERAYDLGVADYIRRPFERIMILRRVKNILMLYAKQKRLTAELKVAEVLHSFTVLEWAEKQAAEGHAVEPWFSRVFDKVRNDWRLNERLTAKWFKAAGCLLLRDHDLAPLASEEARYRQKLKASRIGGDVDLFE